MHAHPGMRLLLASLLAIHSLTPLAQGMTGEQLRAAAARFPAIQFKAEPLEEIGAFSNLSNTVFKPRGDGPFPAIVLVHTCGGIKDPHIRAHARDLLGKGFVVLVQDSFNPRGRPDCGPNNSNALPSFVGASDAYGALKHLTQYPFVDRSRIYQAGYSFGGFVATLLASSGVAEALGASGRFRATIAHYSPCRFNGRDVILQSTDRPVLMLLGEKDAETPAASCFPVLEELKAAGKPVQWHVFPGATHGWDKRGQAVHGYIYNEETTQDAMRRMLEFIEQNR
jgi:dienelactone hydrolase